MVELRRLLYALYAVLRLRNVHEGGRPRWFSESRTRWPALRLR
jgi:hypothetical protein